MYPRLALAFVLVPVLCITPHRRWLSEDGHHRGASHKSLDRSLNARSEESAESDHNSDERKVHKFVVRHVEEVATTERKVMPEQAPNVSDSTEKTAPKIEQGTKEPANGAKQKVAVVQESPDVVRMPLEKSPDAIEASHSTERDVPILSEQAKSASSGNRSEEVSKYVSDAGTEIVQPSHNHSTAVTPGSEPNVKSLTTVPAQKSDVKAVITTGAEKISS